MHRGWREEGWSVGGGDIKDEGKSDPLVQTKQAEGFRDKGNAIHHVTVNATHASPVWLHSAFHSFRLYQAPNATTGTGTTLKSSFGN